MFTLTLDIDILEIKKHEEKLSYYSPLQYLSFGTDLIDFGLTEVNLQAFKHGRLFEIFLPPKGGVNCVSGFL